MKLLYSSGKPGLEVIKRGKEKHNPDGTGDTVKKYLWFYKIGAIIGNSKSQHGEKGWTIYVHKLTFYLENLRIFLRESLTN